MEFFLFIYIYVFEHFPPNVRKEEETIKKNELSFFFVLFKYNKCYRRRCRPGCLIEIDRFICVSRVVVSVML